MRRRRKFKGTWFPIDSPNGVEGPSDLLQVAPLQGTFNVPGPASNGAGLYITHVTVDEPQETSLTTAQQLNDVLGQEYALRRIVGKFHLWWGDTVNGATAADLYTCQIIAGFFIARASASDPGQPEGFTAVAGYSTSALDEEGFQSFSPLAGQTIREPWIWRRSWILGNPPATEGGNLSQVQGIVPSSTMGYGSVLDGPHLDAKTRRRIKQDERLFFALGGRMLDAGDGSVSMAFEWTLDVRLFGAMRRARNSGAF